VGKATIVPEQKKDLSKTHLFKQGSFEYLEVVRRTLERYGRALAYYVVQHSIFRFVEHHGLHVRYALGLDEGEIQFRRALRSRGGREFKLSHCGGERVTVCLIPNKKLMAVKNVQKVGEFHI